MKLLKWVLGQIATYWVGVLLAAVAGAVGVTALVAKEWIERMYMLSLWPVAVPRWVFWPWLVLTVAGICFLMWAFFRGPPATAQNHYAADIVEDWLWRWDVASNPSNARLYGVIFNLTRYCPKCHSDQFFRENGQEPMQSIVVCANPKCQRAVPVIDLQGQTQRVTREVTRRASTSEWKEDRKRIRQAAKGR
jgi:hypothetical protein